MITQAYFEDIQRHIKKELSHARHSILIAVAWFTDPELFEILCDKAQYNISISLIVLNDRINKGANGLDFRRLRKAGGEVYLIGSGNERDEIMHNKFCVIDNETVITGSYNWTLKAQRNDENITVTKDSREFADEFILQFQNLIEKHIHKHNVNYNAVCKRLEILRNTIALQDEEDIEYQLDKLKKIIPKRQKQDSPITTINMIIGSIEKKAYGEAVRLLSDYLDKLKALTVWVDPEIPGLKLEIRVLEVEVCSLQDEKADIEKCIREFESRHNAELGEIILQILNLRKSLAKQQTEKSPKDKNKQQQYQEASQDYEQYQQGYEHEKLKKHYELTPEQQKEIKNKYRQASKLCHPDAVSSGQAEAAAEIFKKLNEAYASNDLETVKQILEHLETGRPFESKHVTITEKGKLQLEIVNLRQVLKNLLQAITNIKDSEPFQVIVNIEDWDEYFINTKQALLKELESLKKQWMKTEKH